MRLFTVIGMALALVGCGPAPETLAEDPGASAAPDSQGAPAQAPAAEKKSGESQTLQLGNVTGEIPRSWKEQTSNRQFRMAEYAIPKAPGDPAGTQLIVFHFGKGQGGGVEDNIKRWRGMVRPAAGAPADPKPKTIEREGLKITTVELSGTYLERPFPFSDEVTERPNYRMLAAIVETTREDGEGPYYLRIVGPAKTVTAAKPGWDRLIETLKVP